MHSEWNFAASAHQKQLYIAAICTEQMKFPASNRNERKKIHQEAILHETMNPIATNTLFPVYVQKVILEYISNTRKSYFISTWFFSLSFLANQIVGIKTVIYLNRSITRKRSLKENIIT